VLSALIYPLIFSLDEKISTGYSKKNFGDLIMRITARYF
jgi:hypothetical protein